MKLHSVNAEILKVYWAKYLWVDKNTKITLTNIYDKQILR